MIWSTKIQLESTVLQFFLNNFNSVKSRKKAPKWKTRNQVEAILFFLNTLSCMIVIFLLDHFNILSFGRLIFRWLFSLKPRIIYEKFYSREKRELPSLVLELIWILPWVVFRAIWFFGLRASILSVFFVRLCLKLWIKIEFWHVLKIEIIFKVYILHTKLTLSTFPFN